RVRASNAGGDSGYSNIANAKTPLNPPSNLSANAVSASEIDLTWSDTSNSETGFKIERSTDGSSFTQVGTVNANVTSYADTGLSESTTYYYRVRASSANGDSDYSNIANATTSASVPAAPTNLMATATSSSDVGLTW